MVHIPGAIKQKELWYFYSTTCPWCQKQEPVLNEFLEEHPEVDVVKINVDEDPEAADMNGIKSFPVIIPLIDGSFKKPITGYSEKEGIFEAVFGK